MALVTDNNWFGFQEYDSEDPEIIYKHPLTTDKDTADLGTATMTDSGAGNHTYDPVLGLSLENGGNVATDNSYLRIQLTNAADYNPLSNAGCITFWLSNIDYFETVNVDGVAKAYSEVFVSWTGPNGNGNLKRVGSTGRLLSFVNNTNLTTQAELVNKHKTSFVRVDISWTNGIMETYVDYKLSMRNTHKTIDLITFDDIGVGDRAGANSFEDGTMRNFMISHRPIMLATPPKLQRIVVMGDSFMTVGNYPASSYVQIGVQEDGQTGTSFDPSLLVFDGGWASSCEKELNQAGYAVGDNGFAVWSEGGSGIETAITFEHRTDDYINSATHRPAPTMLILHYGTNDNNVIAVDDITDGTWKASYQAQLDRWIALGVEDIIIMTAPPINVSTVGDTEQLKAVNLALNVEIRQLEVDNVQVTVIDEFSLFGGHDNFDPNDFGNIRSIDDDRHPSWWGYEKIGKWMADGILKRMTA